jgi:hypothetical protein
MKRLETNSTATLFWCKTCGCLRIFGLRKTARWISKEISRALILSRRDNEISMLTEKSAIGAAPKTCEDVDTSEKQGFINIIDSRSELKRKDLQIQPNGFLIRWNPTYDDWRPKTAKFLFTNSQ